MFRVSKLTCTCKFFIVSMLWTHQIKVLEIRQVSRQSTNTQMAARHVVTKLLTVSRKSKVDYQNKVLQFILLF